MTTRRAAPALGLSLTAALLGGLLGGATATTASAAPADGAGTVGAAGIGDPYFPTYGNGGYRVGHYDVDVRWDAARQRLSGDTTVVARTTKRLSRFDLDLVVRASKVWVDGTRARFRQDAHELVVTPRRTVPAGERMRVRVVYAGRPQDIRYGGVKPFLSQGRGALAVGQPDVAPWWFPANDHPSDKATFDVAITTPKGMQAISNGNLLSRRAHGALRTWRWRSQAPMATYLAFAAIGHYDLDRGTRGGRPYLYAYDRALGGPTTRHARSSLERTTGITDYLAGKFGPYPFGAVGGVVTAQPLGYALENQTRPVYDKAFFTFASSPGVVVHEMAHQWFGDAVALDRWRGIWLNEGYATLAEWMYSADHGGASLAQHFDRTYDRPADDPFWKIEVRDPGADHLFAGATYERGAMALYALRDAIGPKVFLTLSRRWVADNADGLGSTGEYVRLAEKISGQDLGGLFRTWVGLSRKPARGGL